MNTEPYRALPYADPTGNAASANVDREMEERLRTLDEMPNLGRLVSPDRARLHMQLLEWRGVRMADVARATGLYRSSVLYIRDQAARIREENEEAILAIRIPHPPSAI